MNKYEIIGTDILDPTGSPLLFSASKVPLGEAPPEGRPKPSVIGATQNAPKPALAALFWAIRRRRR